MMFDPSEEELWVIYRDGSEWSPGTAESDGLRAVYQAGAKSAAQAKREPVE